ncbi:hypothetical protein FIBSPDRAFT_944646 [Athelia psychrophila]|uniref:Uncharacterized protein n=1 Tax=Athelia psychrophila TaxID=1759441 RepID=A0A166UV86_9AGAM|nr:hypothetical protein FIBSPDRAFT_944646 [Fibularhizoctonia sp. CBS 109695]
MATKNRKDMARKQAVEDAVVVDAIVDLAPGKQKRAMKIKHKSASLVWDFFPRASFLCSLPVTVFLLSSSPLMYELVLPRAYPTDYGAQPLSSRSTHTQLALTRTSRG